MSFLKSISKGIRRNLAASLASKKLSELRAINIPAADKIANAINDALNNNLNSEEKKWIEQIEELRSELKGSSAEVTITDYGAGDAELDRSEEQMYEGVQTIRSVAKICSSSKPYFWALVLFKLIREFKPATSVELGTCLGISAAYQAAAHKINNIGNITTMEGASSLASLSEKNLKQLGLDNVVVVCGRFQDNLENVFNYNESIDYAFIDGHHDEKATISYFESFIPNLSDKAVIIFDDIMWSDGMQRAWKEIVENENVKIAVDLKTIGICVLDKDLHTKHTFQIPIFSL